MKAPAMLLLCLSCTGIGFAIGAQMREEKLIHRLPLIMETRFDGCNFKNSPLTMESERLVYLAGVWRAACVAEMERRQREASVDD